jgi:hypothetical protein
MACSDVLLAVCLSMVRTEAVVTSSHSLRDGLRRIAPDNPEEAATSLLVQLLLAAGGFAVLAVRSPPGFVMSLGVQVGSSGYGFLAWAAVMSVGVAVFGATAHAVLLGNVLSGVE